MGKYLNVSGLEHLWLIIKTAFDQLITDLTGKADRENGIYYIEGGGTAGVWTGSCSAITNYYKGLTVALKLGVAGSSSGSTLNINNLGAVPIMMNSTSKLTTHYPATSIILLIYTVDSSTAYWKVADYNSDTKLKQYKTTSGKDYKLLFTYGSGLTSDTTNYARYSTAITVNPVTNTITATGFDGTATKAISDSDGLNISENYRKIPDQVESTVVTSDKSGYTATEVKSYRGDALLDSFKVYSQIGSQGTKGTQGTRGLQGYTGIQGIKGSTGAQGTKGTNGTNGSQGIQGLKGIQGTSGKNGTNGSNGSQGIQGIQGIQGPKGSTGSQGTKGSTGSQGAKGIQGTKGTNGTNGSNGSQGIQGLRGLQGIKGSNGTNGTNGSQGIQGITGLQGPKGSTGSQGAKGSTGSQGAKGTNGTNGTNGVQGIQGLRGIQGIKGSTGSQGAKGTNGTNGSQGYMITAIINRPTFTEANWSTYGELNHVENWSNNNITRIVTSIRVGDYFYVQGNASDTGNFHQLLYVCDTATSSASDIHGKCVGHVIINKGSQGIKGIQGIKGTNGSNGTNGTNGSQGIQGLRGLQGTKGSTGSQGAKGVQGIQGIRGIQGITGTDGNKIYKVSISSVELVGELSYTITDGKNDGDIIITSDGCVFTVEKDEGAAIGNVVYTKICLQGIQGPKGTTGSQGTKGIQGLRGLQGTSGKNGINGKNAIGAQGIQGIQGTKGATGSRGIAGARGLQGIQGTSGKSGNRIVPINLHSTAIGGENAYIMAEQYEVGDSIITANGVIFKVVNNSGNKQFIEVSNISGARGSLIRYLNDDEILELCQYVNNHIATTVYGEPVTVGPNNIRFILSFYVQGSTVHDVNLFPALEEFYRLYGLGNYDSIVLQGLMITRNESDQLYYCSKLESRYVTFDDCITNHNEVTNAFEVIIHENLFGGYYGRMTSMVLGLESRACYFGDYEGEYADTCVLQFFEYAYYKLGLAPGDTINILGFEYHTDEQLCYVYSSKRIGDKICNVMGSVDSDYLSGRYDDLQQYFNILPGDFLIAPDTGNMYKYNGYSQEFERIGIV